VLNACGSKQRRVALFSATHTPPLAKNAATNLVEQELLYCGNENGKLVAFRQLVQKGLKPPVLEWVERAAPDRKERQSPCSHKTMSIASVIKQSGCEVPEYMLKMKQDPNRRKKRMTKAPNRDHISTEETRRFQRNQHCGPDQGH
ncbi:putative DEAD box ATP-dependent RNA helicase, partial [Operophtera brumata]